MRNVKKTTNNKWVNLYNVVEPEKGVTGFEFAERKGKDSVAFMLYNKSSSKFILNKEYLPPVGRFLVRAFGGSLDKNVEKTEIVKNEVLEEAGYNVSDNNIIEVGRSFVSSMMNQYCYLYFVLVEDSQFVGREPENDIEALAEVIELDQDEIAKLDDWKSITILSKIGMLVKERKKVEKIMKSFEANYDRK